MKPREVSTHYCRDCNTPISRVEGQFYSFTCEKCFIAKHPEKSESAALDVLVITGCAQGFEAIKDEERRINCMQALINAIYSGGFCDDKQQLVPVPDSKNPQFITLMKLAKAKQVAQLRNSISTRIVQ